ncbi:MAG: hypothetical protein QM500_10375 [Methylococcales bacterium]
MIKKPTEEEEANFTPMPEFTKGKAIPIGGIKNFMEGHLYIAEKARLSISGNEYGFLGGRWHAEKKYYLTILIIKYQFLTLYLM